MTITVKIETEPNRGVPAASHAEMIVSELRIWLSNRHLATSLVGVSWDVS